MQLNQASLAQTTHVKITTGTHLQGAQHSADVVALSCSCNAWFLTATHTTAALCTTLSHLLPQSLLLSFTQPSFVIMIIITLAGSCYSSCNWRHISWRNSRHGTSSRGRCGNPILRHGGLVAVGIGRLPLLCRRGVRRIVWGCRSGPALLRGRLTWTWLRLALRLWPASIQLSVNHVTEMTDLTWTTTRQNQSDNRHGTTEHDNILLSLWRKCSADIRAQCNQLATYKGEMTSGSAYTDVQVRQLLSQTLRLASC